MSYRFALGKHITNPENAVYKDKDFVVISDGFPKSTIHYLILPTDKSKNLTKSPIKLLNQDPDFYKKCTEIVSKVESIVANELSKKWNCNVNTAKQYIKSGMHAIPSMAHMHIHVLSTDLDSARLKRAEHYTSFTTKFFVPFSDIPSLKPDCDEFNEPLIKSMIKEDLICHYCGQNFKRSFTQLKTHLSKEYQSFLSDLEKSDQRVE